MKLAIAVKSCQAHLERGDHDIIRGTWGKDAKALGIDVRFFVGASANRYQADETHLKCPDDYDSLPYKTREICRWTNGKMVDHIFLCDTDTFLIPKKLLASGFEQFDYAGKIDKPLGAPFKYESVTRDGRKEFHPRCYPWASGGFGYFLSRKAFTEIAFSHPDTWAEDLWVGQVLGPMIAEGNIKATHMPAHVFSWHFPSPRFKSNYEPRFKWMEQMYAENK